MPKISFKNTNKSLNIIFYIKTDRSNIRNDSAEILSLTVSILIKVFN